MLENMLYKRASCLEDYRDLSTLVDRVMKARQTCSTPAYDTIIRVRDIKERESKCFGL